VELRIMLREKKNTVKIFTRSEKGVGLMEISHRGFK